MDATLKHIWHPCAQMKDYEIFKPMEVIGAQGSYIKLADGRLLIDAISSWWCKTLGHGHPRLQNALITQAKKFEHVMLAHLTHEPIMELSKKLTRMTKNLSKVFYASEGSSAVEIALKMSLHARKLKKQNHKNRFLGLAGAYHGETCAALSVSDLPLYRQPYRELLFEAEFLKNIPYVQGRQDPLWNNCAPEWRAIENELSQHAKNLSAIIVEPLIQGAAGMRIYSADFLKRLRQWTCENDIHLIADEIMTGLGRTGSLLACHQADIEADFVCLGKGLTSGWLPLSAVLTSEEIFQLFYDDYDKGKSFLHSHTFSGNALAAAVAVETLDVLQDENILQKANALELEMKNLVEVISRKTGRLENIRALGGLVAADLKFEPDEWSSGRRFGFEIARTAAEMGALLRPLGKAIYWLPPLNISRETLRDLQQITQRAIEKVF